MRLHYLKIWAKPGAKVHIGNARHMLVEKKSTSLCGRLTVKAYRVDRGQRDRPDPGAAVTCAKCKKAALDAMKAYVARKR